MNKHQRDCLRICGTEGLDVLGVEPRGRHWMVHGTEGSITCPSTPSDWRGYRNVRALARRLKRGR